MALVIAIAIGIAIVIASWPRHCHLPLHCHCHLHLHRYYHHLSYSSSCPLSIHFLPLHLVHLDLSATWPRIPPLSLFTKMNQLLMGPCVDYLPCWIHRILSAEVIVLSLCAMTMVVRLQLCFERAVWIRYSENYLGVLEEYSCDGHTLTFLP
jgi:hypothetical protein